MLLTITHHLTPLSIPNGNTGMLNISRFLKNPVISHYKKPPPSRGGAY